MLREISVNAQKDSKLIATVTPYNYDLKIFMHNLHEPEIYVVATISQGKLTLEIYDGKDRVEIIDKTKEKNEQ